MKLSVSNVVEKQGNLYYPHIVNVNSLDDFKEATLKDHSVFLFKNNIRNELNFLESDVLVIDIDNEGDKGEWMDIDLIKQNLSMFECFILPSRNCWKQKVSEKGVILEERPKYHVYFPLKKTYNDLGEMKALYIGVLNFFPFADQAVKDAARFIFGYKNNKFVTDNDFFHNEGMLIDEVIEPIEEKKKKKEVVLSEWANPDNFVGVKEGSRASTMVAKLGHLKAKGFTPQMIKETAYEINKTYNPPLDYKELDGIVDYAIKGEDDPSDMLKNMQKRYQMILLGGAVFVMKNNDALELIKPVALKQMVKHQRYRIPNTDKIREVFSDWEESEDTTKYGELIFDSKGKEFGKKDEQGLISYNQWRGFSCEPEDVNINYYLDHIKNIICRGKIDDYEYVLNWMADVVQHPTSKRQQQTALVILGEKGSGKGTFATCFGYLFNDYNYVETPQKNDLFSKFNTTLSGKCLVYGNEIEWPGDKESENIFKALITSNSLRIEKKFADAVFLRNNCRFIIDTNGDWAAPVSGRERRFAIFTTSNKEIGNTKYFRDIDDRMKVDGKRGLLHFLLNRDISKVDWYASIPKGENYTKQKQLSNDIYEKFFEHNFQMINQGYDKLYGIKSVLIEDTGIKTIHSYRHRFNDIYIYIKQYELRELFEDYVHKYGSINNKNYDISNHHMIDRKFRQIFFEGKSFRMAKVMKNGENYYKLSSRYYHHAWKRYTAQ